MTQKGRKSSDEKIGDLEVMVEARDVIIENLRIKIAVYERSIGEMEKTMSDVMCELNEYCKWEMR